MRLRRPLQLPLLPPITSPLFLEAIHSLDKTKTEFQLDNEQVYYYIIKKLPILLSGLGFPLPALATTIAAVTAATLLLAFVTDCDILLQTH